MVKGVSRVALVAFAGIACASIPIGSPMLAQTGSAARNFALSQQERAALAPVQQAIAAGDYGSAASALNAARSSVQSGDAIYLLGNLQLRVGVQTSNLSLQRQGVESMIASGSAPAAELPQLYKNQAALALTANDTKKAEAALTRLVDLAPNDQSVLLGLAQLRATQKRGAEALAMLDRAIALRKASGAQVPESWYKFGARVAFDGRDAAELVKFNRAWIAAYPSPKNWRDVLLDYRDVAASDPAAQLDSWRLIRAMNALSGERDYYALAGKLASAGEKGPAKAVIEEGTAAKMVDSAKGLPTDLRGIAAVKVAADKAGLAAKEKAAKTGSNAMAVADAYLDYGNYAKAAAMYRTALEKGGVDADVANSRLALALALAGQKAEAQTALQSVTGARAGLASLMMVWLGQPA